MGCCGCRGRGGAAGCQCAVEAGANVNVTGTGTPDDPWVVASSGEVSDTLVQIQDTATLNLSISGDGSVGNPYIISGVVVDPGRLTVQDTASLNLTLTGSGTTADPYVISGVVDPTNTQVQDTASVDMTISGSGTDADPYIISATVDLGNVTVDNDVGLYQGGMGGVLAIDGDGSAADPFVLAIREMFMRRRMWLSLPQIGSTGTSGFGVGSPSETGTATSVGYDPTTKYGRLRKREILVTTPATNAVAGFRWSTPVDQLRGDSAGVGGFYTKTFWGPATGVATATYRAFCGVMASGSTPTDVDPSTLVSMVGMGWDDDDTNVQVFHNDAAGTAVKVDLGASWPVPTSDRTAMYSIEIWAEPNGSEIFYRVTDIIDGDTASGSFNSEIPAAATQLTTKGYVSAGGTSSEVGIAWGGTMTYTHEEFG